MNFADLFRDSAWIHLGLSLAHFLWQGAAIAMLLAVGLFALRRRSPEVRHGLCLGAMIAMMLCPLATLAYYHARPPTGILRDAGTTHATAPLAPGVTDPAPLDAPPLEASDAVAFAGADTTSTGELLVVSATEQPDTSAAAVSPAVEPTRVPPLAWGLTIGAWIWAVGVAVLGVRFVIAWLGLRRLRAATEALPEAVERLAARLRSALSLNERVAVRASSSVREPLAFGLLRPIVLVPASLLTQCPVEMLEAMIAHELAHIRRHDLWVNLFQRAVETLLFYHPAVWWVSGRMRLERELCCDDAAIRATGKRADYADALVTLSRTLHGWTVPALSAGMFTARLSLPQRVRRVLQVPSAQHDPNRGRYWITGPATLLLAGSLVLVSSLRPSAAQDSTAAGGPTTTQPAVGSTEEHTTNPRWWKPVEDESSHRWENVKLADVLGDYAKATGLNIVATQVPPADLQKVVHLQASGLLTFDAALSTLNTALLDMNYWVVMHGNNLEIRPLVEWYRHIPAEHMYMSEDEYRRAKLPEWDVASTVYTPQVWPADQLRVQAMDRIPLNGARATVTPDGGRVELAGFVRYINIQLAILKKWDKAPAPDAGAATLMGAPGMMPGAPGGQPFGGRPSPPAATTARPGAGAGSPPPAATETRRLRAGDQVSFHLRDPETKSIDAVLADITINREGDIDFLPEHLGVIHVAGLTTAEASQLVTKQANAKHTFDGDTVDVVLQPAATAPGDPFAGPASPARARAPQVAARPLIDGIIAEVLVKPGQRVKNGDLLVRLDDAEARIELEAAKTRLQQAQVAYERAQKLRSQGTLSTGEMQKMETDVKLAELEVRKWELRLERAQVRSPIDGIVATPKSDTGAGLTLAETLVGTRVTAGDALLQLSPRTADATSPFSPPAGAAPPRGGTATPSEPPSPAK